MDDTKNGWSIWNALEPLSACALSIAIALDALSQLKTRSNLSITSTTCLTAWACIRSPLFSPATSVNVTFAQYQLIFLSYHAFLHLVIPQDELRAERQKWQAVHGRTRTDGQRDWYFAYKMLFNPLCLGTKWEVKVRHQRPPRPDSSPTAQHPVVQPKPAAGELRSSTTTTNRRSFLLHRLLALVCRTLLLTLYHSPYTHFTSLALPPFTTTDYLSHPSLLTSIITLLTHFPYTPIPMPALHALLFCFHLLLKRLILDYVTRLNLPRHPRHYLRQCRGVRPAGGVAALVQKSVGGVHGEEILGKVVAFVGV